MKIFKVCYNPDISYKAMNIIRKEVTASMISQEEDSFQYCIDMSITSLENQDELLFKEDIKYLKELNVEFIEF